VAHVELSLSELTDRGQPRRAGFTGSLELWASVVDVAQEPCLLVNLAGIVVAASPGCGPLFGLNPGSALGRRLVDDVLRLLDFNAVSGELPGWEVDKIPPLLAITTGGLARGLLRIPGDDGTPSTVDAISVPLREDADVVGSLTFFARVQR
jgi:PAS domain-containing protein